MAKIGTVKFMALEKGYGFVIPEAGGGDVFLHIGDLNGSGLVWRNRDGLKETKLVEGTKITYDEAPGKNGKGPKAINVAIL